MQMRCYKCGSLLNSEEYCPNCGVKVTTYKLIVAFSYCYYNEGLDRARSHDLSGAERCLTRSIKYYKRNIEARNLLGLVYYEQGRAADALAEWIVSSNIMPGDNPANDYINDFKADKATADRMNREVRLYNEAVEYLQNGNADIAYLQLSNLIRDNTKLVDAYLLMAIFCINGRNFKLATECVKKVLRMDKGNYQALKYRNEILAEQGRLFPEEDKARQERIRKANETSVFAKGNRAIIQPQGAMQRDDTVRRTVISAASGVIACAMVFLFLIMPHQISKVKEETNQTTVAFGDDITTKDATISELEVEVQNANNSQEKAEEQSAKDANTVKSYETLIQLNDQYNSGNYNSLEMTKAMKDIEPETLSAYGRQIYDTLYNNVVLDSMESIMYQGELNMGWGQYPTAIEYYQQAVEIKSDYNDGEPLYMLAKAYAAKGDTAKAKETYQRLIKEQPKSGYVSTAKTELQELNVADPKGSASQDGDGDDE